MTATTTPSSPAAVSRLALRAGGLLLAVLGAAAGWCLLASGAPSGSSLSSATHHALAIGLLIVGTALPLAVAALPGRTLGAAVGLAVVLFAHAICLNGQVAVWPQRFLSILSIVLSLALATFAAVTWAGGSTEGAAGRRMAR